MLGIQPSFCSLNKLGIIMYICWIWCQSIAVPSTVSCLELQHWSLPLTLQVEQTSPGWLLHVSIGTDIPCLLYCTCKSEFCFNLSFFCFPLPQLPRPTTRILLSHFKWDKEKLLERWAILSKNQLPFIKFNNKLFRNVIIWQLFSLSSVPFCFLSLEDEKESRHFELNFVKHHPVIV